MKNKDLVHFVEWKKITDEKLEETFAAVRSWGVEKLVAHPCWGMKEENEPGSWNKISALLEKYHFAAPACHAYWNQQNDISSPDPLGKITALHSRFLEKLFLLNVRTYTMHIAMESDGSTPWNTIAEALERLLPAARKCNIILALENGHENCAVQEELARFVTSFNDPFLGVCFDTGHAHCYGDRQWERSLDILAPHIVTCHLHDNNGTFDDHDPPGRGSIDWKKMCAALKELPRLLHAETESGEWNEESWNKFREVWE